MNHRILPRIRLELLSPTANNARVYYVQADGTETEISNCVTGVDVHAKVGEITSATLHVLLVEGHTTAEVRDIIVKHIKAPRRRWWKRHTDVTRFGAKHRSCV